MSTTTTPVQQSGQGLAIAALLCTVSGFIATLTIIGSIIGVPLIIVGLILAVVSLVTKKRGRGMAWASVVIGILTMIGLLIMGYLLNSYIEEFEPTIQTMNEGMQKMMDDDPALKELFEDPVFMSKVEHAVEQKMTEKMKDFIKESDGIPNPEDFKELMNDSFEAFKETVEEERTSYKLPSDGD